LERRTERTQGFIVRLVIRGVAETDGKKSRTFPKWTTGKRASLGPALVDRNLKNLVKRFDCCRFVVFHVEHGIELGDLEQIVNFFGQIQQLEVASLVPHCGKRANQLPNN